MATIEQIRLLTIRGRSEGLDRVQAELAGISRAQYDVARAGDEAARVSDASARKQLSAAAGWSKLASEMQGSSRAAREYAQTLRLVAQAEDQGLASAQQAAQARMFAQTRLQTAVVRGPAVDQSAINAFLGIEKAAANSARASADAFDRELSRLDEITRQRTEQAGAAFRESLNRSFNIGGTSAASQGATFSALDQQMRMAEEVEAARRAQAAVTTQQNMSDLYGIGGGAGSARASAAVFEAAARETEELERRVAALRAQIDPLTAAQNKLNAELVEYRALAASGAISAGELAAAETMVAQRLAAAEKHIGSAGNAVKLTSMQMTGLGYQINDVATMLAMGASPFMVISSQAGQVVQVLGDGPGGVRGSLSAMKIGLVNIATSIGPVVGGFGILATAAVAYSAIAVMRMKSVEETIEEQDKVLRDLAKAYDIAGIAAEDYSKRSQAGAQNAAEVAAKASRELLAKEAAKILVEFDFVNSPRLQGTPGIADLKKAADDLSRSIKTDLVPDVQSFERALVAASKATTFAELKKAYSEGAAALEDLVKQQLGLEGLNVGISELERRSLAAAATLEKLSAAMGRLVPDTRTVAEQIQSTLSQQITAIGHIIADNPRVIEGMLNAAYQQADKARAELARQEDVLRQGRALDLRAVYARTTAEQALIAEERVRLDLEGQALEKGERAARIAAASALIIAQANREAQETLRSSQQNNSMAGMEGYQAALAGIIYRYQEQIDAADGAADAVARLTQARNLDIQTLQIQTQRQLFGSQEDALASLRAEAAALGATDDERRRVLDAMRAEQVIRRAGINATGEQANAYRANAAALSDYEESIRRAGDAWGSVRQAGESAIDSLVDSLSSGDIEGALESIASDITKTFMELAVANPLKNALLGTSYGTISDLFANPQAPDLAMPGVSSVASMQVTAAVVNLEGMGLGSALGGAPLGQVERGGALGAVQKLATAANDNMGRYLDALASIESRGSGDYAAIGPTHPKYGRALGRYQIMEANVGPWSKAALGRALTADQFMANPSYQDAVAGHRFGGYVDRFGPTGAAQAWFGGAGSVGKLNRQDVLGTSVGEYGERFNAALDKLGGAGDQLASGATAFTQDFSQATGAMTTGLGQIVDQFLPGFGGITKQMLDVMSQALQGMGGGLGGNGWQGTGPLGKLVSDYFTVGVGGGMDPWAGLRFDTGGYTGAGGRYEPAGIVHRGEIVWSQMDIARAGGVGAVEALRLGLPGYASGGRVDVSIPSYAQPSSRPAAPRVSLQIINNGAPMAAQEMQQTQDAEGNIDIKAVMGAEARAEMTTPGRKGHRQLAASFGLKQQVARR